MRVAIKGHKVFNQIGEMIKERGEILIKSIREIIENEKIESENDRKSVSLEDIKGEKALLDRFKAVDDEYKEIKNTGITTMEGLFYYLEIPLDPNDKSYLNKKLKDIRVNKTKPNKYKKKGGFY